MWVWGGGGVNSSMIVGGCRHSGRSGSKYHTIVEVPGNRVNGNTPSTGTKRIDCIGKCHSDLRYGIISSSKTAIFRIL